MKPIKPFLLILFLSSTAYAQPWGGSFNPEGPSSAYQIFTGKNKFVGLLGASDITVQQALETLSYISASPTTINSRWNFNNGKLGFPKYTTCPASCNDGDMCYDSDATSGQRIYACESGTWTLEGDAGIGGSGDSIFVNGSAVVDANLNESNPSTPASGLSVKWQTTGSSPAQVTGYAAVNTSAVLAGVISDETGTAGKLVFDTSPTLVTPNIGVATATSVNKVAITAPATSATLTIADGKTLTVNNTATIGTLTDAKFCTYTAAGTSIDCTSAGGGGGDSILINGTAVTDANFNESVPSIPASGLGIKWQRTGSNPDSVTGYAAVSTSAVLAGVISDETGSSGGVAVFSSAPTIQNATLSNYVIIPNSANPTVTTAGSVSVDTSTTTGSTLRFYGDAQYSLHGYKSKSFVITGTTASSDAGVWKIPFAITIKAVHVLATGGTNVVGQLANCDANGANCSAIDSSDITATAGTNANDDGALSSPSIAANNYVGWLTTSVSGTNTRTVVTFEYTEDAVN